MFLWLFISCKLSMDIPSKCTESTQCAETFGVNSICKPDGTCGSCSSNEECVTNFGQGQICPDANEYVPPQDIDFTLTGPYCEDAKPSPRCNTSIPDDIWNNWENYRNAYIIGQLFDNTTDSANIAASSLAFNKIRGFETLVDAEGNEKPFVQISCSYENDDDGNLDGLRETDAVEAAANYLVNEIGVKTIIGPAGSDDAEATYNIAKSNAVIISPSATSSILEEIDGTIKSDEDPGTFWRTVGSDKLQAQILANLIDELEPDNQAAKIGIIVQESLYGVGFADVLIKSLVNQNINYERENYTVDNEELDEAQIRLLLSAALNSDKFTGVTGVVLLTSDSNDITGFIKEIADHINYVNTNIFLTDSAADSLVLESINEELSRTEDQSPNTLSLRERIRGTKPALPDRSNTTFTSFEADLRAEHQLEATDNVFAAYTYDAAWLGFLGTAWAHYQGDVASGKIEAKDIARGLREISDSNQEDKGIELNWPILLNSFESGQAINVSGASSLLDFANETEELVTPIETWVINENNTSFNTETICYALDDCE